jgi:cobalt-zinc-cadmium efflux system protein
MNAHTHDHGHDHDDHGHDHDHGHSHGGHHHHASPDDPRYLLGIGLNLTIVVVQVVAGFFAHSTALLADASHNLSDVLGLVLAGGAAWLALRPARGRRTYGYGKATVLAAVANGLVLMLVSGGLIVAAVQRLIFEHDTVQPTIVMAAGAVGVVVNLLTALMFMRGAKEDVNVRGVFIHMAGDAVVSLGVIVAAGVIALTGWNWLDPAVSIVIVLVIVAGTWGLLKESLNMALDAAPAGADVPAIEHFLEGCPGVTEVHDLHVWAMSTTEVALTAHLVRPGHDGEDGFRGDLAHALEVRFGVRHATVQIEKTRGEYCPEC